MSIYEKQYEMLKEEFHKKIAPLYALFPWDDLFGDTIHGSYELDCFVDDALADANPNDEKIIKSYIEALSIEKKYNLTLSTQISEKNEFLQMEKVTAAQNILEKTDAFVKVMLDYYKKRKY